MTDAGACPVIIAVPPAVADGIPMARLGAVAESAGATDCWSTAVGEASFLTARLALPCARSCGLPMTQRVPGSASGQFRAHELPSMRHA